MVWTRLPDGRSVLPPGTVLEFENGGGRYRITGEPLGYGGSGILYPAVRLVPTEDGWTEEEMRVALKECYPLARGDVLSRDEDGRILGGDNPLYSYAREMMRREKAATGQIYNKGFRLIPVWGVAEKELISLDGKQFAKADNLYGIMERLDEKGVSLGRLFQKKGCFTAYESICIVNQVLCALREVHENGFLHGDIQENNIFMKGNNEEKGELGTASLIDFGSARPLREDGATDPIEDRNLYITSGYAAWECIHKNDGTLRLTKAADLYSAGYLMLRLFTGKALDARTLRLVVNDKYFYGRQARKIGCPSGNVESVNRILLKALQKDPAMRYQTADEMLEDTMRLERALSPQKSAIASVDYGAFISYCHEEKSIQAAEAVQKLIERYKIPKAVRPSDGRKRLGKVFRDREELSSSSDMEVHLKEALAHSEYLIVLLDPKVPDSPWVGKEIELFLENHDREHILTVIVEGEPEEVFPPILRQEEKYDGGSMKLQKVESLAADIRGDTAKQRRKKLKTEIYRLLAPMLGCGYDDLRQRQKEYRQRRLLRTMTAAVVFLGIIAGYVGWQAYQIHENYWATLVKQSRYLAQVSSELLSQGDRLKAIAVAMEALPSGQEDHSRPLVAEAEASLVQALYCYQGTYSRSRYLEADKLLSMEEQSLEMETVSADGNFLLTADQGGTVYLWSIDSGECVRRWDTAFRDDRGIAGELLWCNFLSDEEVLLVTEKAMAAVSIQGQEVRVIRELNIERDSYDDTVTCAVSEDGAFLAVYELCEEAVLSAVLSFTESVPDDSLTVYRTSDGEIIDTVPVASELLYLEEYTAFRNGEMVFDPEGRYVALTVLRADWEEDADRGVLLVADLQNNSYQVIEDEEMRCQNICFSDDGNVIVFGYGTDLLSDAFEVTVPGKVSCYDPETGNCIWEKSVTCQKRDDEGAGLFFAEDQINSVEQGVLLVWCNREMLFLNAQTGEELKSYTCEESIVGVRPWENGWILGTRDGDVFTLDPDDLYLLRLGTNVEREVSRFLYAEQSETVLLVSEKEGEVALLKKITDDNFHRIELKNNLSQICVPEEGEWYAVYTTNEEALGEIVFYDAESHQEEASVSVDYEVTDTDWISNNEKPAEWQEIFCYIEDCEGRGRITAYDAADREVLWQTQTEYPASQIRFCHTAEGSELALLCPSYFYGKDGAEDDIEILDLQTGKTIQKIACPDMNEEFDVAVYSEMQLSASGRYLISIRTLTSKAYKAEKAAELQIYDREKDCWLALPDELSGQVSAVDDEDHLYVAQKKDIAAVYEEEKNQLSILDLQKMELIQKIPFYGGSQRQAVFMPGDSRILLWGDDGYLKLWDMEQECILMEDSQKLYYVSEINVVGDFIEIRGVDESKLEFVHISYGKDSWFYLWEENGRFYPYFNLHYGFYASGTDQIGCVASEKAFIWYDRYTLDELLEKARETIGDYTLTKAERMKYFIEE